MREKPMRSRQKVPVPLYLSERDLLVRYDFPVGELTAALEGARVNEGQVIVHLGLSDLDDLLGFIAGEANHADDPEQERELDYLYGRLQGIEGSYG